ncbi:metabolite traffic protein EboE [Gilvimarinus sp. SDUM040013]|uniref:Metabolite traffic protein EboE n=1 Tax=Gilvimarinus gilvus TaxID=3058038 RepID=A0ABU4S1V7_9GAMM|nr:metabolite traffic protein EboE [Gilvimarinus sp. SDUM040013]MDO3385864.1 metabolite traffic protein EboE [Gilvimarinus sp. SDUM040013]MDX6851157.1 metabolite traffic protein EboE [Gilvimarinus sp. SDUM040013]
MAALNRALTYCSNIHPGESWADIMHNLNSHALDVKQQLGGDAAFPLGLRIAHQAAQEVDDAAIAQFQQWCKQHNAYLLTINGFPYGTFHETRVKENVYLPDWRERERVEYSKRLGDLAVALQPDAKRISISTVPIAFKPAFKDSDWATACSHVLEVAEHFQQLTKQHGIELVLAIEPEPECVLETTEEAIEFFQRLNLPSHLKTHVGLCFDCCHQAVEFETATECLARIKAAGITIGKVQVSSALKASGLEIEKLLAFDEPVYLHQAVARCSANGALQRFADLPEFARALANGQQFDECRVHFHIPIFCEHLGEVGSTQDFLIELLPLLDTDTPLEVETYSFKAIPEHLRHGSISENIARELTWVGNLLADKAS